MSESRALLDADDSSVVVAPERKSHNLIDDRTAPEPTSRQRTAFGVDPDRARQQSLRWLRGGIGLVVLALIWEFAPRLGLVDSYFVPPLSEVLTAGWEMIADGSLLKNLTASLQRAAAGFAIAVAAAIPLGFVIAWYRPVYEVLNPVLELFRNTAALALLPAFTLVLGIGEVSKIALIAFACFFPILLTTAAGVRSVDPLLLKAARALALPDHVTFVKVVLPATVPTVFTGLRMAAAISILVLIAAEMIGATSGLGYLITASQQSFQIPAMYAGIITIALLGLVINTVMVWLENRLTAWR